MVTVSLTKEEYELILSVLDGYRKLLEDNRDVLKNTMLSNLGDKRYFAEKFIDSFIDSVRDDVIKLINKLRNIGGSV